jgi:hypothetical protein
MEVKPVKVVGIVEVVLVPAAVTVKERLLQEELVL